MHASQSSYLGLPSKTYSIGSNKVYGVDDLGSSEPAQLEKELKHLLNFSTTSGDATRITNIVNIWNTFSEKPRLSSAQFTQLKKCLASASKTNLLTERVPTPQPILPNETPLVPIAHRTHRFCLLL